MRTTLLGLLIVGVVPIALADETSANNKKMDLFLARATTAETRTSCNFFELSNHCTVPRIDNRQGINSDLGVNKLAKILLSNSIFSPCLERSPKDLWQSKFSKLNYVKPQWENLPNHECVFSGQKLPNQDYQSLSTIQAPKFSTAKHFPAAKVSLTETPKFPKVSRSSLIVDFPSQDSSFIPQDTKLANPAPATKRIASPFGWRRRPYSNQLQFHQGIDYGAPLGSPVVAVNNGIVTKVVSGCADFRNLFCGGQLGNWIEIDHGNGAIATYGHLKNNSITVKEGMKVRKNQEIAQIGSSGWSTGAHLDFRFKLNGKHKNPAKYVKEISKSKNKLLY